MRKSVAIALAVALVMAVGASSTQAAKKKWTTINGCTAEQVQSPGGSACVEQGEKELLAGEAYIHTLFCDGGGMQCCRTDGVRTFACKPVSAATQGSSHQLPSGGFKSTDPAPPGPPRNSTPTPQAAPPPH